MKKVVSLLLLSTVLIACKNSESKENTSNLESYTGEFIYTEGAATFMGDSFIYGVTMDDMAEELAKRVNPVKNDPYDMVEVVVKGVVVPGPEGQNVWKEFLTIKEIVSVSDTPSPADIRFEDNSTINEPSETEE